VAESVITPATIELEDEDLLEELEGLLEEVGTTELEDLLDDDTIAELDDLLDELGVTELLLVVPQPEALNCALFLPTPAMVDNLSFTHCGVAGE
jgi:hypothetical protein